MQKTGYRSVPWHWGCSPRLPTKQVMAVLSCGYGKTSWEIPGPFTCWSQSLVFSWSRALLRLVSSSFVCVMGLIAHATKLKFRRGGAGALVRFLYHSWCSAMPMYGVGSVASLAVGDQAADREDTAGAEFHAMLLG